MWASLRLDGELSELEGALLDAHLGRCADCSAAVAAYGATVTALRSEPLVPAAVVVPARRGSLRPFIAATAATLLVSIALGGAGFVGAFHLLSGSSAPSRPLHVSAIASSVSDDYLLLAKSRVVRAVHPVFGRPL
jgi:anti-sigma factor RsiW